MNTLPFLTRILTVLFTLHTFVLLGQTWQSELVQIDESGYLTYSPDSLGNIIPDYSTVGFQFGDQELPNVVIRKIISPVPGDNTSNIQQAIDFVSSFPVDSASGFRGTVLLKQGVFRISGSIYIDSSGVVLRGTGDDADSNSNTIILGTGNNPVSRTLMQVGGTRSYSTHRWFDSIPGTRSNIISDFVPVGGTRFEVEDATKYKVGDNIIIFHPCSKEWLVAIDSGGTDTDPGWQVGEVPLIFNTYIKSISCNTITTISPVYNSLDRSLTQAYIYKPDKSNIRKHIGVENLRIDVEFDPNDILNHAKSCLNMFQLEHSWAKNVTTKGFFFAGIETKTASHLTLKNCKAIWPAAPTSGGFKDNFTLGFGSQNLLFDECYTIAGRHSYISNGAGTVAGVVFYRCISEDPLTSSEGHRQWTTGLLFDNFRDFGNWPNTGYGRVLGFYNRGNLGLGQGWTSVNCIAWNCDLSRPGFDGTLVIQKPPIGQNYAIGCSGLVTGNGPFEHPIGHKEGANLSTDLEPHSLYEAQVNFKQIQSIEIDTTVSICDHDSLKIGSYYYSESGFYNDTMIDMNGCDSIIRIQLLTFKCINSDISDICYNDNIIISPNPFKHSFKIDFNNTLDNDNLLEVYDANGRRIIRQTSFDRIVEIDLRGFPPGSYHLRIYNSNTYSFKNCKLIKTAFPFVD